MLGIALMGVPAARPSAAQEVGTGVKKALAEAKNPNAILDRFKPSGASKQTASQDGLKPGVEASRQMAKTDGSRLLKHRDAFNQVGEKLGLPPALLAGIASRESRGGAALKDGWGDNHNAFGIMQVDKRYHKIEGQNDPSSQAHIMQASRILKSYRDQVRKKHPDWPPVRQLQGAVVAYNSGVGNVQTSGRNGRRDHRRRLLQRRVGSRPLLHRALGQVSPLVATGRLARSLIHAGRNVRNVSHPTCGLAASEEYRRDGRGAGGVRRLAGRGADTRIAQGLPSTSFNNPSRLFDVASASMPSPSTGRLNRFTQ